MSKDVTLGLILPLTHWNFGEIILDSLSLRGLRIIPFSCSAMSTSLLPHELHHTDLPVLYCLPKFAQIRVHCFNDAIQPSHPLLPPSPALSLSKHQGLFQWVSSLHHAAHVLKLQFQFQFFQWIFTVDFLAVQGTLKSFLQHHSLKSSIPKHSAFFVVWFFVTLWTVARLLCPWNFQGKNTGVDSHSLLQGIFLTQGLIPGLLHCSQILYYLSQQGSLG